MKRDDFSRILDLFAVEWVIDSNEPVKGQYKTTKMATATGPRRRTNHKGEIQEANDTGYPQIIKWKPRQAACPECGKIVLDPIELINLKHQYKKSKCGCKTPFSLDSEPLTSK